MKLIDVIVKAKMRLNDPKDSYYFVFDVAALPYVVSINSNFFISLKSRKIPRAVFTLRTAVSHYSMLFSVSVCLHLNILWN